MTKDLIDKILNLIIVSAVAISFGVTFNWSYLRNRVEEMFSKERLEQSVKENKRYLEQKYLFMIEDGPLRDFEIEMQTSGEKLSLAEKAHLLEDIKEELAKYPQEYIAHCNPLELRLLGNLSREGIDLDGFYDKDRKSLNVGVDKNAFSLFNKINGKLIIDHELFHALDIAYLNNEEWNKLNKNGGNVYLRKLYDFSFIKHFNDERPEGFSREYGLKNEKEDKATIAEALMTDTEDLEDLVKEDSVLSKKVKKMKEYFFKYTNGKMNDEYWNDLKDGKVDENYWKEN